VVDALDLAIVEFNLGNGACNPADVTGDGYVTEADIIWMQNNLQSCD
jgi:hypothetical protein